MVLEASAHGAFAEAQQTQTTPLTYPNNGYFLQVVLGASRLVITRSLSHRTRRKTVLSCVIEQQRETIELYGLNKEQRTR